MYTVDEGGGASGAVAVLDTPTQRWASIFHRTNGWLHAPPGSHFERSGEMVELVGAVHRCGRAWYASSISKLAEESTEGTSGPADQRLRAPTGPRP
jgi:hypothetical protein